MKENVYNMLSNLFTDQSLRTKAGSHKLFLNALINRITKFEATKDLKFVKPAESLLGTFVNLLHE